MRPVIIVAPAQDIDRGIGLWPLLRRVKRAVCRKVDALHVTVAPGEDISAHAVQHPVAIRDHAIKGQPQRFALVGEVVLCGDLISRGQGLRLYRNAIAGQLIIAQIADGLINLAIWPYLHAPRGCGPNLPADRRSGSPGQTRLPWQGQRSDG